MAQSEASDQHILRPLALQHHLPLHAHHPHPFCQVLPEGPAEDVPVRQVNVTRALLVALAKRTLELAPISPHSEQVAVVDLLSLLQVLWVRILSHSIPILPSFMWTQLLSLRALLPSLRTTIIQDPCEFIHWFSYSDNVIDLLLSRSLGSCHLLATQA